MFASYYSIGINGIINISSIPGSLYFEFRIRRSCSDNFLVNFPIFEKIDVKGTFQASIYKFLTDKKTNPEFHGDIQWNFVKFLIGKKGKVIARFDSEITPDDPVIVNSIEEALAQK